MTPSPIIIKPGIAVYGWAMVLLGVPTIVAAISTIYHPEENTLPLLLILLLAGLVFYYWISRHRVVITEDTLEFSEPFCSTQSIKFVDIEYFLFYEPGEMCGTEMNLSPLIELVPAEHTHQDSIRIRLKIFSLRDSELLVQLLAEKISERSTECEEN